MHIKKHQTQNKRLLPPQKFVHAKNWRLCCFLFAYFWLLFGFLFVSVFVCLKSFCKKKKKNNKQVQNYLRNLNYIYCFLELLIFVFSSFQRNFTRLIAIQAQCSLLVYKGFSPLSDLFNSTFASPLFPQLHILSLSQFRLLLVVFLLVEAFVQREDFKILLVIFQVYILLACKHHFVSKILCECLQYIRELIVAILAFPWCECYPIFKYVVKVRQMPTFSFPFDY